jgi:integrase
MMSKELANIASQELSLLNENLVVKADRHIIRKYNDFVTAVESGEVIIEDSLPIEFLRSIKHNYKISSLTNIKYKLRKAIVKHFDNCSLTETERQVLIFRIETEFKKIKTGSADCAVQKHDVLSRDDLNILFEKAGTKTGLIIQALYQTACRVSELINIKLKDAHVVTDEAGRQVMSIKVLGKGSKERRVYMSVELFDAIKKSYNSGRFLFGKKKTITRKNVNMLLSRAGRFIGRHINPHLLRHTFATLNIDSLGLSKVSKYLGHSDTSTTAKYYLHGHATSNDIALCW